MVVQRITHAWRLTSGANVKPDLLSDMHVLIWAFGNATTNDGKVLFFILSRGVGVDECGFAGFQLAVANNAVLDIGHLTSPLILVRY